MQLRIVQRAGAREVPFMGFSTAHGVDQNPPVREHPAARPAAGNPPLDGRPAACRAIAISRRNRARALDLDGPSSSRGRRECRALATPMARLQKESRRQSPQVQPRHPGIPRAMVFTLISCSPRCTGSLATVAVGIIARPLSASVAAPGPHDFTSASCRSSACKHAAAPCGHRLPASRLVTIAIRPSWRSRMARVEHIFWKNEREIFQLK